MLHITDGAIASELLKDAEIDGEKLSWDDVLHEGPVPAGLELAELSKVRAQFIGDAGWDERSRVMAKFAARDAILRSRAREVDEIVLQFEADLYDQLQLLQVLDLFAGEIATVVPVKLIALDGYFGSKQPKDMVPLLETRQEVTEKQFALARRAWAAFRAEDPTGLTTLLEEDLSPIRFLRDALRRHLEEFPSMESGITRTEWQILAGIMGKEPTAAGLFKICLEAEERAFLGDTVFLWLLEALARGETPLVAFKDTDAEDLKRYSGLIWRTPLALTPAGKQVLSGRGDWMTMSERQLWRGGVRLDAGNDWRYLSDSGTVERKA